MNAALATIITDGTFAALFLAIGLGDMTANYCETGCLQRAPAQEAWTVQASGVVFQQELVGKELYIGYDTDRRYGPFHITYGAAITDVGDAWVGVGARWSTQDLFDSPFFFETSLLPGLYVNGDGPAMSTPLQFRSSIGAGYAFENGARFTVFADHRSNGDTAMPNPGIETVGIKFAVAVD